MDANGLAKIRQALARGVVPVTWDKPTVNVAIEAIETVLDRIPFDALALVLETVATSPRAQDVQIRLAAGEVPAALIAVVEDWLVGNPPSVTIRVVDEPALDAWITSNESRFSRAVQDMPTEQQQRLIRLLAFRRVKATI